TFRGRLGFTVTPTVLLYVTGGGAWGEVKTDLGLASVTAAGVPVAAIGSGSTDRFGWTFGGGIEAMFAPRWSAKFEYLYMDLGTISNSVVLPTAAGLAVGANVSSRVTDNIIRGGINYHFYSAVALSGSAVANLNPGASPRGFCLGWRTPPSPPHSLRYRT